jgi:hypothetical protein
MPVCDARRRLDRDVGSLPAICLYQTGRRHFPGQAHALYAGLRLFGRHCNVQRRESNPARTVGQTPPPFVIADVLFFTSSWLNPVCPAMQGFLGLGRVLLMRTVRFRAEQGEDKPC